MGHATADSEMVTMDPDCRDPWAGLMESMTEIQQYKQGRTLTDGQSLKCFKESNQSVHMFRWRQDYWEQNKRMTRCYEHVVLTQGTFGKNSRIQKAIGLGSGLGPKVMVFRTSGKQTEVFKSQDPSCRSVHSSLKIVLLQQEITFRKKKLHIFYISTGAYLILVGKTIS